MTAPTARQLVKDGHWVVPVEERPNGWENWPIRVAVAMLPDILRCECGRPLRHTGKCTFRALRLNVVPTRYIEEFRKELQSAIKKSARVFGADEELQFAAEILFAGIFGYRSVQGIRQFVSAPRDLIRRVSENCILQKLWLPDGTVRLGRFDQPSGDLEFWLLAMAAAGQIEYLSGKGMFQAKRVGRREVKGKR